MPRLRLSIIDYQRKVASAYSTPPLRLFGERGYGGTALQSVADELGLTKASVYYYFPAKVDLLEALAEPCLASLDAIITDPPDTSELANCRAYSTPISARSTRAG